MSAASRIRGAINGRTAQSIALVATSAAISAAVTYKIASKRIEAAYALKIDEELEATRAFYIALNEKPTIEQAMEDAGLPDVSDAPEDLIAVYQGLVGDDPRPDLELTGKGALVQYNRVEPKDPENDAPSPVIELPAPEVRNVFDQSASSEVLPQEMIDARDGDVAYIISMEEFNEGDNPSETLTFYADDQVLADQQEMPVDDIDQLVGPEAVTNFGLGSGDSRVVYVRNERISMDYEIVLHDGNYGEVVHGITAESPPGRKRTHRDE